MYSYNENVGFCLLDIEDFKTFFETLHGIFTGRRSMLVSDETRVTQVRNRIRNEAVIELLRVIDFQTARHTRGVNVVYPGKVISKVANDVAVCDLNMVDVEDNLHARRIDLLADIETPREVIEGLIRSLIGNDFGIGDLHAQGDALLLGVTFDPVEVGDSIIDGLFHRHTLPIAGQCDEIRASCIDAHVDAFLRFVFELGVIFFAD